MKFGFIPTEGGPFYREFLEEVLLGEALGFDSVWLEEHHGAKNLFFNPDVKKEPFLDIYKW